MTFHPIIKFPSPPEILDFTSEGRGNSNSSIYTIGRYDELRSGLYTQDLFSRSTTHVHMGVDLGAPAGTQLFAFAEGKIVDFANHSAPGDYGPTLITEHYLNDEVIFVLWGHLSRLSLTKVSRGQRFEAGDVLAEIGDEGENGGWPPHVHIQLSRERPVGANLPGVVSIEERAEALRKYPDPRLVLESLFPKS